MSDKIKTWIHGFSGKMGQEIQSEMLKNEVELGLVGGSDQELIHSKTPYKEQKISTRLLAERCEEVDLIIDFSTLEGNDFLYRSMEDIQEKAILIGTTGLHPDSIKKWEGLAQKNNHRILIVANTSLGIFLLSKIAAEISPILFQKQFDIEIFESHHRAKVDSPSGTALLLADSCQKDLGAKLSIDTQRTSKRNRFSIGIQSQRGGGVYGEHSISFLGDNEEIVISHRALSRKLFAQGAVVLGAWIYHKGNSGLFRLEDIAISEIS